ncbi:MAG TPA: GNAT family N-acetyltransferase [Acidimicrobiales bacterium]|nr:GNAT family N-acetyltransferase [Acidimicrobiales bacterium]
MRVERLDTARSFLDVTAEYRAAEPLRTNVLASVATSVADGIATYESAFWWVMRDGDDVVGAAMRTVPQALSLGPMPAEAAEALAATYADLDPALPALTGPRHLVSAFLDRYRPGWSPDGGTVTGEDVHVLYAVEAVRTPEVPGAIEVAAIEDLDLVERWFVAFDEEVDGIRHARGDDDRAMLAAVVRGGRLRWWRADGRIVSMAGHAIPIGEPPLKVTRVGPVYTPPEDRRHGYGGAVTAALSTTLLEGGSRVMLFADARNATSNHVYQDLGYERVDEIVRTFLAAPS